MKRRTYQGEHYRETISTSYLLDGVYFLRVVYESISKHSNYGDSAKVSQCWGRGSDEIENSQS